MSLLKKLAFIIGILCVIWFTRFRWYIFPAPTVEIGSYSVKYMEPFNLHARVILTTRYYDDQMADFCPIDLALAWGPMAEPGRLEGFKFSQRGRWLYNNAWSNDSVEYWDMRKHISNMHVIPADDVVKAQLFALKPNDSIYFKGHLVRVDNNEGRGIWVSSRSRTDIGGTACEIVYITEIIYY